MKQYSETQKYFLDLAIELLDSFKTSDQYKENLAKCDYIMAYNTVTKAFSEVYKDLHPDNKGKSIAHLLNMCLPNHIIPDDFEDKWKRVRKTTKEKLIKAAITKSFPHMIVKG